MRALLFDLYGLFLALQNRGAYLRMASEIGVDPDAFRELYEGDYRYEYDAGVIDASSYWTKIGKALGVPIDWKTAVEADLRSHEGQYDDMVAYARELRDAGVTMGMLSNIPEDFARLVSRRHPWIGECFDPIVFSCDLGLAKPDPALFEEALERLGRRAGPLEPGDVLYIDDDLRNVEVGARLGLAVHHYRTIEGLRPAVSRHLHGGAD